MKLKRIIIPIYKEYTKYGVIEYKNVEVYYEPDKFDFELTPENFDPDEHDHYVGDESRVIDDDLDM